MRGRVTQENPKWSKNELGEDSLFEFENVLFYFSISRKRQIVSALDVYVVRKVFGAANDVFSNDI